MLGDALDLPGTIDLNQQSLEPFRSDAVPNALRAKIQAGAAMGALQPRKDGKPTAMEQFNASMRDSIQPGAGQLSEKQVKLLMDSMDESENVHQARIVAQSVERETEQLLASAFHGKTLSVQKPSGSGSVDLTPAQVIGDYTASSSAFRDLANGVSGDQSTKMKQQAMDKLLAQMHNADGGKPRVTYRYTAYDDQSQCPYDEKSASRIQVGDLITDPNFVSTSAGKQFIQGREATSLKPAQVNMVIYGSSGVPIATQAGSYSNQAQLAAQKDVTGRAGAASGKVQGAGQSEVLYPRNTVFKVLAIDKTQDSGRVIYKVALSEVPAGQVTGKAKNSYTGS